MFRQSLKVFPDCGRYVPVWNLRTIPHPCSLHLVENWVVTSVDGISSVYICTDEVSFALVCSEYIRLMRTRVCPQNRISVNIVCICLTSPGMVFWEAQRIEVLMCRYNGEECVVVFVGWVWESRFDD